MNTKRRTSLRAMSATAVLSVALAGVAGPAAGAEDVPGLCRLLDIDAFAAATGQEYERPPFWDLEDNCKYVATSNPDGQHYVALQLTEVLPYDRVRESALEATDLEIDGHPAFAASEEVSVRDELREFVYVDLDGVTFLVSLFAEEGTIPDQRGHAISLAETAVPALGDVGAAATEPPSAATVTMLDLPTVDGISWSGEWMGGGADLSDPSSVEPLLQALGAEMASLTVLTARAESTEDGSSLGSITAMRVDGADEAALEGAVDTWFAGLFGVDGLETASLGGKDVATIDIEGQSLLVYVTGDTAVVLDFAGPSAERLLEALP
ncbi:MAG: hypothetical protein AB1Z63_09185 [Candidatus Limnocylindrales bacterium]